MYSEDINTPKLAVVGVIMAVLVFATIVAVQVLYQGYVLSEEKQKIQAPEQLRALLAKQDGQLNAYRWVDEKKKIAAIPIDLALELTARDAAAAQPPAKGAKQ